MDWEGLLEAHARAPYCVVLDRDLVIRSVSQPLMERAGYPRDLLGTLTALDLVHPDDLERGVAAITDVASTPGGRPEGMYRLRSHDGSFMQFALRALNLGPEHHGAIVFNFTDADERIRAEAFAEDTVAAMRLLVDEPPMDECLDWISRIAERHVEGVQLVVTRFNESGNALVFSRQPVPEQVLTANAAANAWNLPDHVTAVVDQERQGAPLAVNLTGSIDNEVPGRVTILLRSKEGRVLGYVEALRSSEDSPSHADWTAFTMIRRIIEAVMHRHELDALLRHAADHDSLTGLVNRRCLLAGMEAAADDGGDAVLLLDLDRFGWINNTLGHGAGDDALVHTARCLLETCPDTAVVSRIGGDEFVVWAPSVSSEEDLEKLSESIRENLRVLPSTGDKRTHVRASIGATQRLCGESAADVIRRADDAMYAAKRANGDRIHLA